MSGPDIIASVPLFSGLSADERRWLWADSKRIGVAPGERLIEEGAPGDALFIVLSGELEVTKRDGEREIVLATRGAGQVIGEMSILDAAPRTASVRAVRQAELLQIDAATFRRLIESRPATATLLLRPSPNVCAAPRPCWSRATSWPRSARSRPGLPIAQQPGRRHPAQRQPAARGLRRLARAQRCARRLDLTDAERQALADLERDAAASDAPRPGDPAMRQEEARLVDWLGARAVPAPWDEAPVLATFGWTVERLEALAKRLPAAAVGPVILWLASGLAVRQLLDEIQMSSRAISRIVDAVRSYAYLDRAPVQDVDIRQSLEDTLTILAHKLKHGIEVVRDIEPDLPAVEAYAGELNQVWTNIIDNAAQAMEGEGRLELAARRLGEEVEVCIADSGPGIPAEISARVFEPFFTTKAQGSAPVSGFTSPTTSWSRAIVDA